jgi:hypothetical protein
MYAEHDVHPIFLKPAKLQSLERTGPWRFHDMKHVNFSLNARKMQLKNRRERTFEADRRLPRTFSRSESETPTYQL